MSLPSRTYLARIAPSDAESILDAEERTIWLYYPDDAGVIYNHRGRAYYRNLERKKLKRIAEIRAELGL